MSLLLALAVAATTTAPLPPALRPVRVAGPGLYVRDLTAERDWFVAKLGMQVTGQVPAKGPPGEYILSYGGGADAPVLVLQRSEKRPAGDNLFSRVILRVPDAKGLAAWLKTQGVESREAVVDVAYFVRDPEGNPVELYTPPRPVP